MLIITKARKFKLTQSLRALAQRKVAKLERYMPELDRAEVELNIEQTRSVVDRAVVNVRLFHGRTVFRAQERATQMQVAVDSVVDKLESQLQNYRARQRAQVRGRTADERVVAVEAGPTTPPYPLLLRRETSEATSKAAQSVRE